MNDMKDNGAFTAGLVGAGGGDCILALCSSNKDKKQLLAYLEKKRFQVLEDVNIANSGYEILN